MRKYEESGKYEAIDMFHVFRETPKKIFSGGESKIHEPSLPLPLQKRQPSSQTFFREKIYEEI